MLSRKGAIPCWIAVVALVLLIIKDCRIVFYNSFIVRISFANGFCSGGVVTTLGQKINSFVTSERSVIVFSACLIANSTSGAEETEKRAFKSDCPSLVEWEQKRRPPMVERGPALLEAAVLGAPKIFSEPAVTTHNFRYRP